MKREHLFFLILAMAMVASSAPVTAPATPFRLPVGAKLTSPAVSAKGWQGEGTVSVPYVQARARLLSAVTAAGWRFLHEIPLGTRGGRLLMAFTQGDRELTLMVWRQQVNKSGFSFGISNNGKK